MVGSNEMTRLPEENCAKYFLEHDNSSKLTANEMLTKQVKTHHLSPSRSCLRALQSTEGLGPGLENKGSRPNVLRSQTFLIENFDAVTPLLLKKGNNLPGCHCLAKNIAPGLCFPDT